MSTISSLLGSLSRCILPPSNSLIESLNDLDSLVLKDTSTTAKEQSSLINALVQKSEVLQTASPRNKESTSSKNKTSFYRMSGGACIALLLSALARNVLTLTPSATLQLNNPSLRSPMTDLLQSTTCITLLNQAFPDTALATTLFKVVVCAPNRLALAGTGSAYPTPLPTTRKPSFQPTAPTNTPSSTPTGTPTAPTGTPTSTPTSSAPSHAPTTNIPTNTPTNTPTTFKPSFQPTTRTPTNTPTLSATNTSIINAPSNQPTALVNNTSSDHLEGDNSNLYYLFFLVLIPMVWLGYYLRPSSKVTSEEKNIPPSGSSLPGWDQRKISTVVPENNSSNSSTPPSKNSSHKNSLGGVELNPKEEQRGAELIEKNIVQWKLEDV